MTFGVCSVMILQADCTGTKATTGYNIKHKNVTFIKAQPPHNPVPFEAVYAEKLYKQLLDRYKAV